MSWDGYVTGYLTNVPETVGTPMKDMLASAGIFSQQGAKCASVGKEATAEEITKIVGIITGKKEGEAAMLGGEKFQQIFLSGDEDEIKKAYYKKQGGGLVVALTKSLVIYGVYEVAKKGTTKGAEKGQNQGDAATLVERLAEILNNAGS